MADNTVFGPWIRRFLLEHLLSERNLARNTQRSYRDTIRLLVQYLASAQKKEIDALKITDLSADHVRGFLNHIEQTRNCSVATRNQRLAAIHALARFVAQWNPEHLAWCSEIRTVCFKKAQHVPITYLEKDEMDALLNAPDRSTVLGRRDYVLLLFLYNSGARAEEAASVNVRDLTLQSKQSGQSFVRIQVKEIKFAFVLCGPQRRQSCRCSQIIDPALSASS